MCIIIYSKKGTQITKEELKKTWQVNPDGGGYAVIENGNIHYEKGFMNFNKFYKSFKKYNTPEYEKVIHFRITSKGTTTKEQTHPFKKTKPDKLKYDGKKPVYFMNGTINSIKLEAGLNDTASYIRKYKNGIRANQAGIDLLAGATGARWAVVTVNGVFVSEDFIEDNNLYYSNLNHKYNYDLFKSDHYYDYEYTIKDILSSEKLIKQVKKNKKLYYDIEDYIYNICNNFLCYSCDNCLSEAQTISDIKEILETQY